ncbi:hypothetical protein DES53_11561 [Roseimicrobium gellanilyticum]|uniref:Uncharacterized protein n=1 Tax=Roseimicrobium gellanilyticum TaxID=748857 RepID=A0A366H7F8_9BACT|nr:hypothetical protein [Roseimicrobium gellanilyticum]RBP36920.1 hypothetical protein DES53_11561 [Roseimicrobium gellanilyticum]
MNRLTKPQPEPMTALEYARRHADACVKADVVPGPGVPDGDACDAVEASHTPDKRDDGSPQ